MAHARTLHRNGSARLRVSGPAAIDQRVDAVGFWSYAGAAYAQSLFKPVAAARQLFSFTTCPVMVTVEGSGKMNRMAPTIRAKGEYCVM